MGKFCLQSTLKTVLALKLLKDKTNIVWTSKAGNLECNEILKFKSIENLCYTPLKNGYTIVSFINRDYYYYDNKYYNILTPSLKLLSPTWFINCRDIQENYIAVQRKDGGWNFMGMDGKFLSQEWYDLCDSFSEGYAVVKRKSDGYWNFIGLNGKYLCRSWKEDIIAEGFKNGIAIINAGKKYSFVDKNGHTSQFRFDDYYCFSNVQSNYHVIKDGKIYIIDKFGTIF